MIPLAQWTSRPMRLTWTSQNGWSAISESWSSSYGQTLAQTRIWLAGAGEAINGGFLGIAATIKLPNLKNDRISND